MLTFTRTEIKELIKARLAVSAIFAIAMTGLGYATILALPIMMIIAGIAFVLHELGHKYVAQKYKCYAEFKANDQALVIGALLSLTGIILLAPGAVHIGGIATRQQHGRIALAGPLVNIILALISIGIMTTSQGILNTLAQQSLTLNSYLAIFNLIPFNPFDGKAVIDWNKTVWVVSVAIAGILLAIS